MCWDGNVRHPQEKYPEKNDRGLPLIIMEK